VSALNLHVYIEQTRDWQTVHWTVCLQSVRLPSPQPQNKSPPCGGLLFCGGGGGSRTLVRKYPCSAFFERSYLYLIPHTGNCNSIVTSAGSFINFSLLQSLGRLDSHIIDARTWLCEPCQPNGYCN